MNVLVNGVACETISVRDRGLAYGDGVFRTLRCEGGRLWAWRRHLSKLQADCAALGLACPDEATWLHDITQLNPLNATIKLTVTRGESARGYACDPTTPVTRITQAGPLPRYDDALWRDGAQLRVCDWPLGTHAALAGVKHLNRLDQVMARREWHDAATFDGLMCNARGECVEGVICNLFILQGDVVRTHPLADCGVAGVARGMVLDLLSSLGPRVALQAFALADVLAADEVWLSNSLAGLVPVGRLGERRWADFPRAEALRTAWLNMANEEAVAWRIA